MKKAFTLLELLVVIGIISVLVAIGTSSYSTVQKKARDAKRKGDMQSVQKVMEQCYSLNNFSYPYTGSGLTNTAGTATTQGTLTITCPVASVAPITITTPLKNQSFTVTTSTSTAYTISVTLETDAANPFIITNQQ